MNCSTPGLPVHHQLPEFTQLHVHWVGDAIQPSHPLSSPSPPAFNLSQQQGLFKWVSSSHQVARVLEFQLQHQSFQWTPRTDLLRMDWLDLLAVQGTLKSLLQHHSSEASVLWHSAFFIVQLSHPSFGDKLVQAGISAEEIRLEREGPWATRDRGLTAASTPLASGATQWLPPAAAAEAPRRQGAGPLFVSKWTQQWCAERCSPLGNGDVTDGWPMCWGLSQLAPQSSDTPKGWSPRSVISGFLTVRRTWALDSFSPGFEPFPSRPISQELSDSMGLGSPHGGEGRRPRSGRRNLLKATGRCPVRVTGRFFYSVPRAPPSCLISRLSFWKPTQLAWAEWPAVAAHLPRGSPPWDLELVSGPRAAALKDLPPTVGASSEQQSGRAGQKRRKNL